MSFLSKPVLLICSITSSIKYLEIYSLLFCSPACAVFTPTDTHTRWVWCGVDPDGSEKDKRRCVVHGKGMGQQKSTLINPHTHHALWLGALLVLLRSRLVCGVGTLWPGLFERRRFCLGALGWTSFGRGHETH